MICDSPEDELPPFHLLLLLHRLGLKQPVATPAARAVLLLNTGVLRAKTEKTLSENSIKVEVQPQPPWHNILNQVGFLLPKNTHLTEEHTFLS